MFKPNRKIVAATLAVIFIVLAILFWLAPLQIQQKLHRQMPWLAQHTVSINWGLKPTFEVNAATWESERFFIQTESITGHLGWDAWLGQLTIAEIIFQSPGGWMELNSIPQLMGSTRPEKIHLRNANILVQQSGEDFIEIIDGQLSLESLLMTERVRLNLAGLVRFIPFDFSTSLFVQGGIELAEDGWVLEKWQIEGDHASGHLSSEFRKAKFGAIENHLTEMLDAKWLLTESKQFPKQEWLLAAKSVQFQPDLSAFALFNAEGAYGEQSSNDRPAMEVRWNFVAGEVKPFQYTAEIDQVTAVVKTPHGALQEGDFQLTQVSSEELNIQANSLTFQNGDWSVVDSDQQNNQRLRLQSQLISFDWQSCQLAAESNRGKFQLGAKITDVENDLLTWPSLDPLVTGFVFPLACL